MENIKKTGEMITISKAEYDNLTSQVEWLKSQLKLAKHKQFGASSEKSEPDDYNQLNLFNEAEVIADEISKEEPETVEVKSHRRKKTTFKERLPEDLPVEVIEYTLPDNECDCPECGCQMHAMGQEEREELKVIPAKMVIVKHVRKTYTCRNCEKNEEYTPFKKAVMPEPVIKGSFASPETVAYTMTQKFVMGLPLYRQEQEWNRSGIPISRQTLSNWFITATERWLRPIYAALVSLLPLHKVLHADETTLQVLREPGKTPQSRSYMWLYRTSGDAEDSIILYEYQPGRKYEYPQNFLKGFKEL